LRNPPAEAQAMIPCDLSVQELITQEITDEGIPWHLDKLNNIVGGAKRGTLGLVYAFVDSGKTSFSMAACAAFAEHLKDTKERIVYAGNEEAAPRLSLRLTQAFTGMTRTQIIENPYEAEEVRRNKGFSRVKLFDSISHVNQIEKLLIEWNPSVLFSDQAIHVDCGKNITGNEVSKHEALFKVYRDLAKEYDCAFIGVAQGTGDAENKKYLKLSDIYGSRVAIQGQLDYGIGIGRLLDEPGRANHRFVNIPKNKLLDGSDGRFAMHFYRETCQWKEI